MTTTKIDPTKVTEVLKAAVEAARKAIEGMPDNGTCNMDSPILCCSRPNSAVEAAILAAGCRCWFSKARAGYVISLPVGGQGQTRTTAAERVSEDLQAAGFDTSMWYQID